MSARSVLMALRSGPVGLVLVLVTGTLEASQVPDTAVRRRPTALTDIVVSATRSSQQVGEVPANVTVLGERAMTSSAAQTVPGLLVRIPGFTSRDYQHPLLASAARSAPSFRGLGGTIAGRTLVLFDGIPLNEPFAGAVHWGRVPLTLVDRVEVVRGGGSMAWGSRALGGVINIITRQAEENQLDLTVEGGRFGTYRGAGSGTINNKRLRATAAASWEGTDGFQVIRPDQAGLVDVPSRSTERMVLGKVAYDFSPSWQGYVAANYLDGWRVGPTAADSAPATFGEVRAGARLVTQGGGVLNLSAYGNHRTGLVISTGVSADRAVEVPRSFQQSPSTGTGASAQWSQTTGRHSLTAGTDIASASGSSTDDYGWVNEMMTLQRLTKGNQLLLGGFVQDGIDLGQRWRVQMGARVDRVRNSRGQRTERSLTQGTIGLDSTFATAGSSALNFSLGVRHEASRSLAWRASAYQAFRAPTLSELYRPNKGTGRGNITEANPGLRPERLIGAEVGLDLTLGNHVLTRVGGFWNKVRDPIVDYTIGQATADGQVLDPCGTLLRNQVCRERRNVTDLRTIGLETEIEVHPHSHWAVWAAYTYNPTRVSSPGQEIDGKFARSAARHAASGFVSWENPKLLGAAVEVRSAGRRFDDDINTTELAGFTVVGLRVNRQLWRTTNAYLKVENLLDSQYEVARSSSGIVERGGPRWVMVGLRSRW